jgi:hypothetical protein
LCGYDPVAACRVVFVERPGDRSPELKSGLRPHNTVGTEVHRQTGNGDSLKTRVYVKSAYFLRENTKIGVARRMKNSRFFYSLLTAASLATTLALRARAARFAPAAG